MDRLIDDVTTDGTSAGRSSGRRLMEIMRFGSNPGNLRMHLFVSEGLKAGCPLVVVLHGCTQAVAPYDRASGWSRLAETQRFALLMPSQQAENNGQTCFNWFEPADVTRGSGEVLSIRQMIAFAVDAHRLDARRVFVCGLSAGGAMTAALLATYPEVFAGGAIIAGLPFGTAADLGQALESMRTGRIKEARAWGDAVRRASDFAGPWPSVAIWHGTADPVVKPINAGELVKQWTNVHGVGAEVPSETRIGPVTERRWRDGNGRVCVTEYSLPGLGHGAPVADATPSAPFFLPAGISSTRTIARDWGLIDSSPGRRALSFLSTLLR